MRKALITALTYLAEEVRGKLREAIDAAASPREYIAFQIAGSLDAPTALRTTSTVANP